MICATVMRQILENYRQASGEMYGATVAENALIRATLELDPEIQWEVSLPAIRPSPCRSTSPEPGVPELTPLRRQFGERVRLRPLTLLPALASRDGYMFAVSLPTLPRIAEMRQHLGDTRFPICGLLHAACLQDFFASYLWLFLSVEPGDALVATSKAGREVLERAFAFCAERLARVAGCASAPALRAVQIVDIPLGVSIPTLSSLDQQRARQLLGLPHDGFIVSYVGRLSEQYKADLDPLVCALGRIKGDVPDVCLLVAGQDVDRSYSRTICERARRHGLGERVWVIDNFPEFLKTTLLAAADIIALPVDSVQETFGIAVLEAMAHGKPVVASNWSGYRDLVVDGETGFLISTTWSDDAGFIGSALAPVLTPVELAHYWAQRTVVDVADLACRLKQLAQSPELARTLGSAGRRRAEQMYAWPVVARRYLDLWLRQLEENRSFTSSIRCAVDYNSIFGHYANRVLQDGDIVQSAVVGDEPVEVQISQWHISSSEAKSQLTAALETCSGGPVPFGQLSERGHSSDTIMWLAKKGLLRIVPTR